MWLKIILVFQTSVMKYFNLGNLQTIDMYFSQFWKLESPSSRDQQIWQFSVL